MILIHPCTFVRGEKRHVDEVSSNRDLREGGSARPQEREDRRNRQYHSNAFKPKEPFVSKVIRCLSLTYDDHILDAYSIFSIGIIARLCFFMRL